MTGDVCTCCGQTLPPDDLGITLPLRLRRILNAVRVSGRHGIRTDRLFDIIYGDDIDGGPLSGIKVLHVHISKLNKLIAPHGWRVAGEHTGNAGTYGLYRLIRVDPDYVPPDGRSRRWRSLTTNTPAS